MSLSQFQKKGDVLSFTLEGVDVSLANAIRRTILADCESVSFSTEDYLNSDLKILKNTTSLHNEFILHRLGLIPVNIPNKKEFKPDKYLFKLNKKNNTGGTISVTTNDFEVINTETNKPEDTQTFFPLDPITKEPILITKLVHNSNTEQQELSIEGKASISSGSKNARYIPVSQCVYINTPDKKKFSDAYESHKESVSLKTFTIEESERYFKTDEEDNPNSFDFTIESIGIYAPEAIVSEALSILSKKLLETKTTLDSIVTENQDNSKMRVYESLDRMKAQMIEIKDESHTLGNLLQSYLMNHTDVMFSGYRNPHPLKNIIELKVMVKDNSLSLVNQVVAETCDLLSGTIKKINTALVSKYKLTN